MRVTRREANKLLGTLALNGLWLGAACNRSPSAPRPTLSIGINGGDEGKAIAELAKRYELATVSTTELVYTSLREKLQTSLDTSPYDLVMLDDPWFPELARYLRPLEGIPSALLSDIVPASLSLCYDADGSLRSLPFVGNCQLLFYRQDLLSSAGIASPPTTWSGLLQASRAVRTATKGKASGYCIRGKSGAPLVSDFLPVLWSVGGNVFADPMTPTARNVVIGSSPTIDALTAYKNLLTESPSGALSFDWTEMTVAFTNGTAAMELNWPFAAKQLDSSISKAADGSRRWGITLPPGSEGVGTSMAGNWLLGIPSSAKNPEVANAFLLWLMENQKDAALAGNPPTRTSIYDDKELIAKPEFFFFPVLKQALQRSTPRPRTDRWIRVEDILGRVVSDFLANNLDPKKVAADLQQQITAVMAS